MTHVIKSAAAQAAEAAKAEFKAAAEAAADAKKAAEAAKKAEKAAKGKEAKAEAKAKAEAAAAAAKAAEEARAAAEAKASSAEDAAKKEAEQEAKKAARVAASLDRLTQSTKEEGRGLNSIYRDAKAAAAKEGTTAEEKAQRQEERARLLELAGVDVKEGQEITAADVEAVPVSALISAYKRAARYIIKEADGRTCIADLIRTQKGANVWAARPATAYRAQDLIKGAHVRLILKKEQPQQVEQGKKYEKAKKDGAQIVIVLSAAEAKRREIEARDAEARRQLEEAKREAQAEADRKVGQEAREKAEKAAAAKAKKAAKKGNK